MHPIYYPPPMLNRVPLEHLRVPMAYNMFELVLYTIQS